MKFGAHIYLWTDHWSDDQLHLLDRARNLGLACLEVICGDDVSFNPALARRHAAQIGLDLVISPGGLWPAECNISHDDPDCRTRALAWHRKNIDLAAQLGAVAYTGAIFGHPGSVHRRIPPADELPRAAENLHLLADYAHRAGLPIVLEPMSHFRTHLINTPQQAIHLINLAHHDNLFVLLDTYHMITELRDFAQAIHAARPRLWGLHACENDRGAPGGGCVPWPSIFSALNEISFNGYVILESYNSTLDLAIRRGLFHNPCPDPDAFIRQSLSFLTPHLL